MFPSFIIPVNAKSTENDKKGNHCMLSPQFTHCQQVPLIHVIHTEDQHLLNTIDGEWFEILHHFPWADYRDQAAAY
jgi:hypothetical protein